MTPILTQFAPFALAVVMVVAEAVAQEAPAPDAVPVPPVQSETLAAPPPMEFEGPAVALDGMTVQIDETKLLLFGIAAPDLRAPEGLRARLALDRLIAGRSDVNCIDAPRDEGFRRRAICSSGETDLSEALLAEGAVIVDRVQTNLKNADPAVSDRYDAAEASARQAGKGLWAAFAEPPPPPPEPAPPTKRERLVAWIEKWQAGLGSLAGVLVVGLLLLVTRSGRRERAAEK